MNAHDFPHDAICKAVPDGVYDLTHNAARITVGTSGDTGEFAVAAIRSWWQASGRDRFPKSRRLRIEADAGGRNGCRPRLCKRALQDFADETGLEITVGHDPTGASKWNPIEHRVFGPITINWSGQPLTSLKTMLSLIRGTTTQTGLTVTATQNTKTDPLQVKVSNADFNAINLHRHEVCPRWNYTIKPRSAKNTESFFLAPLVDRFGHVPDVARGLLGWQHVLAQDGRQAAAFDEVHREVMQALVLPDFVDRHDVGMLQARSGLSLDLKPLDVLLIGQPPREHHLHGHDAAERFLSGLVDDSHSSPNNP